MDYFNEHFLETYKRIDKFCQEIYHSNVGITNYIDDMKSKPSTDSRYIANWNSDLHSLKKYRHIRNRMVHEIGTLGQPVCDSYDIQWLSAFHKRLLSATDPLSLLNQRRQEIHSHQKATARYDTSYRTSGCSYVSLFFLIGVLSFAIISVLLYIFK